MHSTSDSGEMNSKKGMSVYTCTAYVCVCRVECVTVTVLYLYMCKAVTSLLQPFAQAPNGKLPCTLYASKVITATNIWPMGERYSFQYNSFTQIPCTYWQ